REELVAVLVLRDARVVGRRRAADGHADPRADRERDLRDHEIERAEDAGVGEELEAAVDPVRPGDIRDRAVELGALSLDEGDVVVRLVRLRRRADVRPAGDVHDVELRPQADHEPLGLALGLRRAVVLALLAAAVEADQARLALLRLLAARAPALVAALDGLLR